MAVTKPRGQQDYRHLLPLALPQMHPGCVHTRSLSLTLPSPNPVSTTQWKFLMRTCCIMAGPIQALLTGFPTADP